LLNGEYGLDGVCLGVPCIINRKGIKSIVETTLDQREEKALKNSAEIIRNTFMLDQ
jgi:malate/lactate dehydrogenase